MSHELGFYLLLGVSVCICWDTSPSRALLAQPAEQAGPSWSSKSHLPSASERACLYPCNTQKG